MSKIKILHFSDIHWHPNNAEDNKIVRDAMVEDLLGLRATTNNDIDLVLFTGDLVLAGENQEHFGMAHEAIIEPILDAAGVPEEMFFICPGNHDIERQTVRSAKYLEAGLSQSLSTVEATNKLIAGVDGKDKESLDAIGRMSNYETYASSLARQPTSRSGMASVYKLETKGVKIGLAAFDNSWRSTGESGGVDRHKLILGERNVDFAISETDDADFAIALYHHPLGWLTDFDHAAVSPRLYRGFDLLAFGHVHTPEPELRTTITGSSILSQSGSFYAKRSYFNGYQVLEFDTDVCRAKVSLRTYFDSPSRHFAPAENILRNGEYETSYQPNGRGQNPELELFLREARPVIRDAAFEQFNIADLGSELCIDPHTAFICPPIYKKSSDTDEEVESSSECTDETKDTDEMMEETLDLSEMLSSEENFLISGGREAGKSSLAHYVATLIAEGGCDKVRLPVIFDFREFRGGKKALKSAASTYLGIPKSGYNFNQGLENGDLFFIVDNFSGLLRDKKSELEDMITKYPKCRWILLSDTRSGADNKEIAGNDCIEGFTTAHIKTLPRKSIRTMTRRWCERTGVDQEHAFTTVMTQITNNDLPRTGYIVTLLLWALQQTKEMERINEAVLIMNMADHLLGKADFRQSLEREFDATSKEITLQAFANFLDAKGGISSSNEATVFLIDFFDSKGLKYDAAQVLSALYKCGILVKAGENIKFKYRCLQEYFLAKYIGSSESRLKEAVFDRCYLNYRRELELHSGLNRENDILIDELVFQIKSGVPDVLDGVNIEKFDEIVEEESSLGISRKKLQKIREKKLTSEQVDDLMDAAEAEFSKGPRRVQKPAPERRDSSELEVNDSSTTTEVETDQSSTDLEKAKTLPSMSSFEYMETIGLLGRVLRSSEFADKSKKVDATRLYLQTHCKFYVRLNELVSDVFAHLVEELNKDGEELDDEAARALRYFLTKRLMLFVSGVMDDELAAVKLIGIFEEILSKKDISLAEKTFLTGLQLRCNSQSWDKHWKALATERRDRRITTEFLVDKLWHHIHTKALNQEERRKVENTALELEQILGGIVGNQKKLLKGPMLKDIRTKADKLMKDQED